jgi:hypothetical protein
MDVPVPDGWERSSDTLYLHRSGVRIERRDYRKREGWILVPVDLDRAVLEFPPVEEGLRQAFEAFAAGALEPGGARPAREVLDARAAARREENADEAASDADDDRDEDDEEGDAR